MSKTSNKSKLECLMAYLIQLTKPIYKPTKNY